MHRIGRHTARIKHFHRALAALIFVMAVSGVMASQENPTPRPKPKPKPVENSSPASKTPARKRTGASPSDNAGAGPASLLIEADMDCRIKLDGENVGVFKAGEPRKVRTSLGEHIIEATSLDGNYRWRKNLKVERAGQVIVQPELMEQKLRAEAAERARREASESAERSRREAAQQEARLQQSKAQESREMAAASHRARRDGFAQIPSGSFMMGDREDGLPHKVIITKWFEMGKYEVTQAQWEALMGRNPSDFKGANLPVENVSWDDAQAFISALNARNDGYVYRLPTEAEWEYACRAGTTGDYGGTGNLHEMGWYDGNSNRQTHPVGQKKPNAWGIYDMHGNVWEWVQDWYKGYSGEVETDPQGASTGSSRVYRGGGWLCPAARCRSALRLDFSPGGRGGHLGFRLVRTLR